MENKDFIKDTFNRTWYLVNFEKMNWKIHKVKENGIKFDGYGKDSMNNLKRTFKIIADPPISYNGYGEDKELYLNENDAKMFIEMKIGKTPYTDQEIDRFKYQSTWTIGKIYDDFQQSIYEDEINNVLSKITIGEREETNYVKICKTPQVFENIGFLNKDFLMKRGKIRVCNLPIEEGGHGITKEQLYNLPKLLSNPAIIMRSYTQKQSFVAILNDIDNNKLPILVSINPNSKGFYDFEQINTNVITSIYGRTKFNEFIDRAIQDDKIIYTNKEIINELEKKLDMKIFNLNYIQNNFNNDKENKYEELIDGIKNKYTKPEQFVKSMNKVKETEGIDIAIKKLQGLKKDFEQSDAIKNQTKNQSFKM